MEMNHVPHAYPEGRYKDQPHASAFLHQRPIEIHRLILLVDDRRWHLDLGPFRNEVSQHLGLHHCSVGIRNALIHQLERPLYGSSHGVLALDDLTEGERRYDCHRV